MPDGLLALPPVLTVEEAATVLRISRGSAYEAVRTGELPHVRIGRSIRVPRAALLALIGCEQESPADNPTDHPLLERSAACPRVPERDGRCAGDR
jgi:excisionase family DNA binding protein